MRLFLNRLRAALRLAGTVWILIGLSLIAAALAEGGLRLAFQVKDRRSAAPLPDARVIAQGYAGAPWPVEHFRELEKLEDRWEPFVYFRQKPIHGTTIRVDDQGRRATWSPAGSQSPSHSPAASPAAGRAGRAANPVRILCFGGSSLWGFGARDDQTIPSCVARELDRRGVAADVQNLAEIGYVNSQELIALVQTLQTGERPDYVLFYDGVNDTTSALLEGAAGLSTNEGNRRREFNILQSPPRLLAAALGKLVKESALLRLARSIRGRLGLAVSTAYPDPSPAAESELAAAVVDRYRANVEIIRKLGRAYGFEPLFFWQPTVFDKPNRPPFETEEKEKFGWAESMFAAVRARLRGSDELKREPAFHDLTGLFDAEPGLVFIDYCHTTESANARIAEEVAAALARSIAAAEPK